MLDKLKLKGRFTCEHVRNGKVIDKFEFDNGITDQGKNNILDVMFHNASQSATWYIGLIDNDGFTELNVADTHETHEGWTEFSDYDEAARVAWTEGAASSKSITNSTPLTFTISDTGSVNGIFVASISTKGSTSDAGILWSTASFNAARNVVDGDELKVTYTVSVQ